MDALFLTTVNGGPLIMRPNNCWEELMSAISLLNYIVLKKKKKEQEGLAVEESY